MGSGRKEKGEPGSGKGEEREGRQKREKAENEECPVAIKSGH